ncbi:MAG: AAA family ATPase [Neisseriaceae bacterium]|nr:MAG: AAA family ATPase [Neisseriaceae bacterium]
MNNKMIERIDFKDIDNSTLQRLCGILDQNLENISKKLNIKITRQLNCFTISGNQSKLGILALYRLMKLAETRDLNNEDIHLTLVSLRAEQEELPNGIMPIAKTTLKTNKGSIQGKTPNQDLYIKSLLKYDIIFGLGPAGTGKTYLAVAAAVDAIEKHQIEKIVLVRPAVEAGEKLGFLPGDLTQKIDPYLRPLYDALYELMGYEKVTKLLEKGLIELAPLAYMRGRTLNNAFIILDEAQNTTKEQMKMFLTRIGFGSKVVITGDLSQIDLPNQVYSGLKDAYDKLSSIEDICFHEFKSKDIIRHPLVQKIVNAYNGDYPSKKLNQ